MRYALVTRADKHIQNISDLTHPYLKAYAEKCGCDFVALDQEPVVWTSDHRPHYRIMECARLLDEYDRLVLMDTDMLVLPNCPNILEEVPLDCIGTIFEDKGKRRPERLERIGQIQNAWGDVGWRENYSNAGTCTVSNCHRKVFEAHKGQYWLENGSFDLHLSYVARKNNYKFHELSYKWNHMTMFSEPWNKNASRFDSYIIHYAGRGYFDAGITDRISQIRKDIRRVFG